MNTLCTRLSLLYLWNCVLGATCWSQPSANEASGIDEPTAHAEAQVQNPYPDKITPEAFARSLPPLRHRLR